MTTIGRCSCLPATKGSLKLEIWGLGGWGFGLEAIRRIFGYWAWWVVMMTIGRVRQWRWREEVREGFRLWYGYGDLSTGDEVLVGVYGERFLVEGEGCE